MMLEGPRCYYCEEVLREAREGETGTYAAGQRWTHQDGRTVALDGHICLPTWNLTQREAKLPCGPLAGDGGA
jgi:hypothetical protein